MQKFPTIAALSLAALCLIATGCRPVPKPKPLEQLNKSEVRGRTIFVTHCSMCHYDREDKSLHGPTLAYIFDRPYLPSGAPANDDRVKATIMNGRNMMPSMKETMTPDQMQDLLDYLHTL